MNRTTTILIVFAMTVTAVSVAVVLNIQFGFTVGQAATLGLALMFALALFHVMAERRRDRQWMETRLAEISAVAGDVNQEVDRVTSRLVRLDQTLGDRVRDETEPLAAEVEVLGQLMKQVADALAEFENRVEDRLATLDARTEALRLAPPPPVAIAPPRPEPALLAREPIREPTRDPVREPARPADPPRYPDPAPIPSAFVREVEAAIRAERIEIHLQPIVTLPQRKVRYYEVLSRLRAADGNLIAAGEFIAAADSRRLMPRLDTFQVIRAFQILKRLSARNREIGLFINLSVSSLIDSAFFRDFSAFLGQNRSMADLVQFEFSQAAVAEMGPLEFETLRAIGDFGYRFSLDNVTDLRIDFRTLSDLGFRTVKISADRLLGRVKIVTGDIHQADFAGHLQRQGMTMIVDRIETESQVIDLLDYDVRLAQGFLFSAPRQVRPEILGQAPAAAEPPAAAAPTPRAAAPAPAPRTAVR